MFINNISQHRFEWMEAGERAILTYTHNRGSIRVYLNHTEVPDLIRGRGVAEKLVKAAFEDIRINGLMVVPICPYVIAFLKEHPKYLDLLDEKSKRSVFKL